MPKTETKPEKKELEDIVKYYTENKDFQTARNYVKTWGPLIEGYPVDVKLQEINKMEKKEMK